jgi:hypothetical protein
LGRRSHWRKTNDIVVEKMWKMIKDLERPNDTIFKHLVVSAIAIIKEMTNMGETTQRIIKIDCKKLDMEKFHELYSILLSYYSFILCAVNNQVRRNPVLKESIKKGIGAITNRSDTAERIFQQLSIYHSKSLNEVDMGHVAEKIWMRIAEVTGFKGKMIDLTRDVYFRSLLERSCIEAIKAISVELNNGGVEW